RSGWKSSISLAVSPATKAWLCSLIARTRSGGTSAWTPNGRSSISELLSGTGRRAARQAAAWYRGGGAAVEEARSPSPPTPQRPAGSQNPPDGARGRAHLRYGIDHRTNPCAHG